MLLNCHCDLAAALSISPQEQRIRNGYAGRKEASIFETPTTPTPSLSGRVPKHKHPNRSGGGSLPPLPCHQLRYTLLVSIFSCLYRS
ncbi:2-methoxy-6-polyprenyl-14-benzoquinol methylase mitochondrial [Zea mays]|uniref:2-methoxy-6-polyprenyl-14-benzoquinol methylase mitochondrial n=1 Tax=Zea mays TaxID=4577 RepID=A0A1D6PE74_MAIZE|nr:2-methoxy-6-polyprenyl-14-benzoquinol methylase mitochondrial [Zea mays]